MTTPAYDLPVFAGGSGSHVFDRSGNRYLDLICGLGLAPLGWQPANVVKAVVDALEKAALSISSTESDDRVELVRLIRKHFGPDVEVLPAVSGTDAVDLALRLARRYTGRSHVAAIRGAFHGSSLAAFALCGIPGWKAPIDDDGLAPLLLDPHGDRAPDELARALDSDDLGCVVLEPLPSNAGFRELPRDWVNELARHCRARGILLIADDVSTFARGGFWSGAEFYDVEPDMVLLGKGLGGGVYPVAAVVSRVEIAEAGRAPGFASSFAWSPPGCAAGRATLETIERHGLVERAARVRAGVEPQLAEIAGLPAVAEVTGAGLGIGVAFSEDDETPTMRARVRDRLLDEHIRAGINPVLKGLVFTPALTIDEKMLADALERIGEVVARI
jgi:acetylornithine/N-succinyldiaminopimelate aminotransferase